MTNLPGLSLADFIHRRMGELEERYEALQAEMEAVDVEREQLARAAKAAGLSVQSRAEAAEEMAARAAFLGVHVVPRRPKVAAERTIKDAVLDVLAEIGHGLTAIEILPRINEKLGVDYPRTSLSPQLSRLKAEGKLIREGIVWKLTEQGQLSRMLGEPQSNEPPEAEAPEGSQSSRPHEEHTGSGISEAGERKGVFL